MKTRTSRSRLTPVASLFARWPQVSCSVVVLTSLGALTATMPLPLRAQVATPLPAQALPVLRGVVSGQAVVNAPVNGAQRSLMTIDQASQRAIIDWRSFNIGAEAEVLFRHPGSTASTLNRIYDANPSVIQGLLTSTGPVVNGQATAGGQLLLINQNGILFNRGAQVNTQSLVASTLNITNERYLTGTLTSGGLSTAAFSGGYDEAGNTLAARPDGSQPGAISVGAGGLASAGVPRLQAGQGGSILLFAPTIDNRNGLITAPDGQVMLAAGSKVYLALNEDPNDITLRGFRVEVEAAPEGPGLNLSNLIRNAGEISADRGNVSLAALAINQEGRISAKTAVQSNGSIFLTARTKDSLQSGSVSLKAGSVTEVLPDANDKATVPDSQSYEAFRGVVDIVGRTIENQGVLRVPGGRIALTAADNSDPTGARVYLGAGSQTSVAGAWADVDFRKNLQTFRVTSNELKNSPDQKLGVLRGATVTVDLRQGNDILALDGYRGAVARTVAEKAASGGVLNIGSTGSVIQREGAVIDASGGGYRYNGGTALTSKLLGDDGKIYDIGSAPQQRTYTQLLDTFTQTDQRWNQTLSVANPLGAVGSVQEAYAQGLAGGVVNINSNAGLVLDGTLKGGVTIDARQLNAAPRGATLRVGEFSGTTGTLVDTQRIGSINWQQQAGDSLGTAFTAGTPLTQAQKDSLVLASAQVFASANAMAQGRIENGFGTLELNSNGRITVPAGVSIKTDMGAEVTLRAVQIDLGGEIRVPSGKLEVRPVSPPGEALAQDLAAPIERVTVRPGATVSTAGVWINNARADGSFVGDPAPAGRLGADGLTTVRAIDGGSIAFTLTDPAFQAQFGRGATLDVSGGASIASNQRVTGGKGGRLSIANGVLNQTSSDWLLSDLRGFSLGTGGELSLSLAQAEITRDGANGVLPGATTRLEAGFFADNGFSRVTLTTSGSIDILRDTELRVQQKNWVIDPLAASGLVTGGDLAAIATLQTLPDAQRLPASLVLNARTGAVPGAAVLDLQQGASIRTDPRGDISLSAQDGVFIDGSIIAPGGRVSATATGGFDLSSAGVRIGSTGSVSTAGVFLPVPNDRGLVQGTVVNGGTVTLEARNSGVNVAAGARVDVSGTSRTVDVATSEQSPSYVAQELRGQAGAIIVKSQARTELAGELIGHAGSAGAAGGSFALEQIRPDGQPTLPDERRIIVTPAASASAIEAGRVDATVNVAALTAAGFDKLRLQSENRIEFRGSSTLDFVRGIRLDAPLLDVMGDSNILLQGTTVSIGQSLGTRQRVEGDQVRWDIAGGTASPALPTRRGSGLFEVDAGTVDIFGSLTINGTALTRIQSAGDIRLIGRPVNLNSQTGGSTVAQQTGSLTTVGDVELRAAQIYPATRTSFTISVTEQAGSEPVGGGVLRVASSGNAGGSVYSAGGKLRLEADTILQGGVLKAPHGEIELVAGARIDLGTGSVTSVSGADLTVPYGTTRAGLNWTYIDGGGVAATNLDAVSAAGKRIEFQARTVDARLGSTVNIGGGGDVQAAEFVPGNGGDTDITLRDNTFAIIPSARLAAMPYDPDVAARKDIGSGFALGNGRDAVLYDSIRVGAGGAVAPGEYVLLPARYALLPDAYLVQLQTGAAYRNLQPGQSTQLANGDVVVAGFRAVGGAGISDSQSVGVVISPGSAVRRSSDFNLSGATFFADQASLGRTAAPRAPWDAGRLSIENATALTVDGSFKTAPTMSLTKIAGRTAEVDIGGSRIAVVDRVGDTAFGADVLQISAASLTSLNASVLLGGTRKDTAQGIQVTTTASEVTLANSGASKVTLPELVLSARELIDVRAGSVLEAAGAPGSKVPQVIEAENSGALVRLSTGAQARVDRGAASAAAGEVRIAAGASLSAEASLLVDATRATESFGQLRAGTVGAAGGSVSLSSVQVSLGATTGLTGLGGLVLSNNDLAAFANLDELAIRAYGAIDLLGDTTLGSGQLARLTLDTPTLRGVGVSGQAAQALITARELELTNSSIVRSVAESGAGALTARAQTITLGAGDKAVSGFASVTLNGTNGILSRGEGSLRAAGALTLDAPRVVADGGSNQTFSASDTSQAGLPVYAPLTVRSTTVSTTPIAAGAGQIGGRLTLEGERVLIATEVLARSGQINVVARGADTDDGVTVASGGVLDARGEVKSFNGTIATADGGGIAIEASMGAVQVQSGGRIDVSAAGAGGAGRVAVRGSRLDLSGELQGRASGAERSGSMALDVATLASFSALNTALNVGGFAEERQLRVRSGDIDVAAADSVAARRVTLSADAGRIDVAGAVGTGAPRGGAQVNLYAAQGVNLAAGSRVVANGTLAAARGGEVRIATAGGELVFDRDASIDVRAGDAGAVGSVTFGVSRDASNMMGASRLEGTVQRWSTAGLAAQTRGVEGDRPASVDVEATRTYAVSGSIGSTQIDALAVDHATFVSAVNRPQVVGSLRDETGALAGARVLGATEVRSTGNLSLDAAWDLTNAQWLSGEQPGTLTLRAMGNLTLNSALGSPDDNIRAGDTWNLRLAAGADLLAANPLTVRGASSPAAQSGSLLLAGAQAKLRTGTGRIDLAAADDVLIGSVQSTIYTAGRIGAADVVAGGNNRWAVDGGSISIRAGGSVVGATSAAGDLWVNEWLRRPRQPNNQFAVLQPTDWWSYRPRFQQGIGTLGGGDIDIVAGADISNLTAVLPTSGRTFRGTDRVRQVDVQGGGDLAVRAGGDIVGGGFMVSRGVGTVEAAGDIGTTRATQMYIMGASSGSVPEGASLDVVAGGSLALQTISNPTTLFVANRDTTDPASGPSFGTQGSFSTFFTYSENSRAGVAAKSGDLSYTAVLAPQWRTFNRLPSINSVNTGLPGAFPASLEFVAFNGDITGPLFADAVTTFPSQSASAVMLAGGSLFNAGFYGSDRAPSSVISPTGNFALANNATRQLDGRLGLQSTGSQPRIVARESEAAYVFELQALTGSVVMAGTSTNVVFTAPSRIWAGVDIVGPALRLQNLKPGDLTEVRADTGDFRAPLAVEIRGPGQLLVQAGRNIDLGSATLAQGTAGDIGGLVATGNTANPQLPFEQSARVTVVASVRGEVNLARMDAAYAEIIALNGLSSTIIDLYRQLATEPDAATVLNAANLAALAQRDVVYEKFVALDQKAPRALKAYQATLRSGSLPLVGGADSAAADGLYRLLNGETDVAKLQTATSVAALASLPNGGAYNAYVSLDERYPLVFADYVQRRTKGALPTGLTPIVFSAALAGVIGEVVLPASVSAGDISSYQTSIQTYGGSGIDLWAPGGDIVIGLTTPRENKTIGVLTNAGGAVRSVVGGDFNINQGKLITAQGGDIVLFSSGGSIDAGRGARTTLTTPAPVRRPIRDAEGNQIGVQIVIPASAAGSGIQSLSSDPDGLGPLTAPKAGDVYLFAPAGTIDAGEAGIRSSGNLLLNAQTVLNASNISSSGTAAGVPVAQVGSLAASVATSGANTAGPSKASEEASSSSASAARAAAAAQLAKPTILVVEVLGFGDKNCKEQDKNCFAK